MKRKTSHHSVRRIALPSGRSIEVVRFHDAEDPARRLHICPECGSELVQPVAWNEAPGEGWELVLECPNCRWASEGTYDAEQVQALEERLDEGASAMLADLKRLAYANMAEDVDRFLAALRADVILPEDF